MHHTSGFVFKILNTGRVSCFHFHVHYTNCSLTERWDLMLLFWLYWILLILLSMHSSGGSLVLVNIIHWTQPQWFTTLKPLLALGPVLPVVRVAIMTNITAERVCQSNGMWIGSPTVCSNPLFLEISEICVPVHLANQNYASVLNVSQGITKISTTACKTT